MPQIDFQLLGTIEDNQMAINAIKTAKHPITGAEPTSASTWEYPISGLIGITVFYPDPEPPRPTIPELIGKWLTEPTSKNRETLWESLISGGYEFEKGAFVFQGRYFSAKRPALNQLNEYLIEYLISTF